MALKVSADAQTMFFTKVFGSSHPVTVKATELVAAGVTFELALYHVQAGYQGKYVSVSLTAGTTALMKGTVDATVAAQNGKVIEDWVMGLSAHFGGVTPKSTQELTVLGYLGIADPPNLITLIKAIRTVTGLGLAEGKKLAEHVLHGTDVVLDVSQTTHLPLGSKVKVLEAAGVKVKGYSTPAVSDVLHQTMLPTTAKPVNAVIDLKDAEALGQKVHGTSAGSVYHTIALSHKGVKVAARLYKGGSISIRAEWQGHPTDELQKLEASGVMMKKTYGSIHFDAAQVPLQRIIGAFLVGTGVNWKQAVMNGADLVVTDHGA